MSIESASEFIRLRRSEDPAEYRRAAHDEVAPQVWRELLDQHPDMHFWLAQNKTVPLDVLRELAASADTRVRAMVASKNCLDQPLFETLADDSDEGVRQRVAINKKTPADIRQRLAQDPEEMVRTAAQERLGRAE